MAVRKLATATVPLDTNSPVTIDMSAYSRYVAVATLLSDQVGAGSAQVTVRGPDGGAILQAAGGPGNTMGYRQAAQPVAPVYSGNITASHGGTPLAAGSTVNVHIFGDDDF